MAVRSYVNLDTYVSHLQKSLVICTEFQVGSIFLLVMLTFRFLKWKCECTPLPFLTISTDN